MSQEHNGYSNFETWCVSLWIWNEEGSYRYWVAQAARGNLAAELEEWATEAMPELQGFYSDLMTHALGMVHWDEIAEGLAEMA